MAISAGLVLKGLGGVLIAGSGTTGIYFVNDYFQNFLTKFDQGLIDFLNDEGKIKFKLKNGDSDLQSFPNFSGNFASLTVSIKTDGSSEGNLTDATDSSKSKGKKEYLKQLNNNEDWTWSCEIKFKKQEQEPSELKYKEDLVKNDDGFFNKLGAESNKSLKIKFIKNCAYERGIYKNKTINRLSNLKTTSGEAIATSNELKTIKQFELRKGVSVQEDRKNTKEKESNLYFASISEFNSWFQEEK